MNDKKQICPFCGSNEFERKEYAKEEKMALCHFSYRKVVDVCKKCGEQFDFTGEDDERFLIAYEAAKKASIAQIIKEFEAQKLSMAYIERALELSQRTLSQWKSKGTSAVGMALMRMLYTYPWLIKVADNKYDKDFSNEELLVQAAKLYGEVHKKKPIRYTMVQPETTKTGEIETDSRDWAAGDKTEEIEVNFIELAASI